MMELDLDYPCFTIRTPLPGTWLFEATKDRRVLRNWGFYDLAHAVLPTKLPEAEFYEEYARLHVNVYAEKMSRSGSGFFLDRFDTRRDHGLLREALQIAERHGQMIAEGGINNEH